MHNMVYLIGRLSNDIKQEDSIMTLAVTRAFKNLEGIYETDFIPVKLYGQMLKNTIEYIKKGDLIGVKGRLQEENGQLIVIADKISFLTSNRKEEEDNSSSSYIVCQ